MRLRLVLLAERSETFVRCPWPTNHATLPSKNHREDTWAHNFPDKSAETCGSHRTVASLLKHGEATLTGGWWRANEEMRTRLLKHAGNPQRASIVYMACETWISAIDWKRFLCILWEKQHTTSKYRLCPPQVRSLLQSRTHLPRSICGEEFIPIDVVYKHFPRFSKPTRSEDVVASITPLVAIASAQWYRNEWYKILV